MTFEKSIDLPIKKVNKEVILKLYKIVKSMLNRYEIEYFVSLHQIKLRRNPSITMDFSSINEFEKEV